MALLMRRVKSNDGREESLLAEKSLLAGEVGSPSDGGGDRTSILDRDPLEDELLSISARGGKGDLLLIDGRG